MKYTVTEGILFTEVSGEGVLYNSDTNEFKTLNETLCLIFKGLQGGKAVEEIVLGLCDEYEIDQTECQTEVEEAIKVLEGLSYISVA